MAITTQAGLITARAGAKLSRVLKASIANMAAGIQASLYRGTGIPTQPAIPTTAVVCDRTTVGALYLPALTTGDTRYIDSFALNAAAAGTIYVLDRIIHSGGLNGTLTTAQNVNTPALPARVNANGVGLDWWLEWYADTGATATTANVAVVCDDNSTPTIAVTLAATRRAGMMLLIIPPTGRTIKSVTSVTLLASTLTAGNFGVTATEALGFAAIIPSANIADRAESLFRPIPSDACLMLQVDCSTTSTGQLQGHLTVIEG